MPHLNELPWQAVEEYFRSNDSVILGTGCVHAHDHIPSGIDNISTEYICRELEKQTQLLVAPNFAFGVMPQYVEYPGTISIRGDLFTEVVYETARCLWNHGARRFFIVNGHGGNTPYLTDVSCRIRAMGGLAPVLEWWQLIKGVNPELVKAAAALPYSAAPGRRAKTRGVETAAAMALVPQSMPPDSVRMIYSKRMFSSALPTNFFNGVEFRGVQVPMVLLTRESAEYGEVGTCATAELGQRILDEVIRFMAEFIQALRVEAIPARDTF